MPANLTPEYHRAEERFRIARAPEEKLAALEEMLRVIPKHKGTDHMQADLRARIAKLRRESAKKGGRAGFSHVIPREGAGQVALAGPPNAGKSALVRALTHATPVVGDYPFTTREPTPGMMAFEDVAFQLVDLPPISTQHTEPWVFDLVRHADLVWLVVDGRDALSGVDEVRRLLEVRRMALVGARPGASLSDADGTARRRAMVVLTRVDAPRVADPTEIVDEWLDRRFPIIAVSSTTGEGLDRLRRQTFEAFDIIRVYTKEPGRTADRRVPFTLPRGATVGALAERIHKDLLISIKFARVWGPSAFDGQAVQKDHVLAEGDIVEIHS